jgi:hypothetical protein
MMVGVKDFEKAELMVGKMVLLSVEMLVEGKAA